MSYTINCTKKLKVQDVKNKYCPYTLHDICNWFYLDKPAIEYYDLQEVKIISYNELQAVTETVSDCLKCIQYPEFIGINFDILEYCVPSLMLGILDNGSAFFNVPSDIQTCRNIFNVLHMRYIFTKYVTSDREVICQLNVHGQFVYLTKLIDVPENTASSRKWHRFAYAIATSGSTGSPKIVKIPHSCILPNITDLKRILDMTEHDKIAQLTNFTFDPCIVEIFLSLSCAATLFMVSKQLKNDTDGLLEKIFCVHVTVLQITPSLLFHKWSTERLKTTILGKDSYLRVLLLGGEPFPNIKLLSGASHSQNKTRLFNIYGITEVSCWSSVNEILRNNGADESCIGEPLSETMFQVRNEDNEIVIRGSGFLYIGSSSRICVVGNETEDDLYKPVFRDTGDIISIDDHGRMLYRGRRNNVIKRFGNKINLRELEKIVMELSFVRNCAALWDAESHKLYLCLSIVKMKEFINLENDVISHLRILPAIYKPDKIIILEKFDFTTNGKICLSSLRKVCKESEMEFIDVNDLYTDVGEIFGNLWSQHIKSKNVGFLTSGGTSITALQVSNATIKTFKVEFPELVGMLLKNLTFNECVNYIKTTLTNRDWNKTLNRSIAVSYNDKVQNTCNTEKCMIGKPVLNIFSALTKQNNFYQYKCRGRADGNASTQKQIKLFSVNISTIEVAATYDLQKCVDASPTVYCYSASELFATVGSHSGIICTVNLIKKNSRPYELKLPDRIEASVLVLANFRGIVGCYDGCIYCVSLKTGEVIWKFQTQDMVKCTAITCAQKSKIFVGSYDHYIYCLSVEDGVQIWKTKASQGGICATGCLHPQSTSVLFGTLDGTCLALRQFSGQVKWRHKLQNPIFVAPVVLQTGYVLFCSVAGTLCCFDIENDCRIWRYEICGNVFSYPVVSTRVSASNSEHVILASHNKYLYCLEMPREMMKEKEPKLRYTLQLHSSIFATPWCEDEYIFVACTDGTFQVLDLSEGKLLVTKRLFGEIFSSPVIHDDLAILGCRDNNLYVLKLS